MKTGMIFKDYFLFAITLSLVLINFSILCGIIRFTRVKNYLINTYGTITGRRYLVHFQRLLGTCLFGAMPFIFAVFLVNKPFLDYGLPMPVSTTTSYLSVGLVAMIILMNAMMAWKPDNLEEYPQARAKIWTGRLLFLNALGRTGYIFSIELLFRGILLYESIAAFGILTAVIINVMLYAFVHIPKGLNATIGSIPFGLILCAVTIHSGTMWAAFFIHTLLALSNEWFSIFHHEEMVLLKAH